MFTRKALISPQSLQATFDDDNSNDHYDDNNYDYDDDDNDYEDCYHDDKDYEIDDDFEAFISYPSPSMQYSCGDHYENDDYKRIFSSKMYATMIGDEPQEYRPHRGSLGRHPTFLGRGPKTVEIITMIIYHAFVKKILSYIFSAPLL